MEYIPESTKEICNIKIFNKKYYKEQRERIKLFLIIF